MASDDPRFVREGRSLRDWLPELLGPDPATRRRAENAVSAMFWGAPVADITIYQHLPPNPDAHRQAWGHAIGQILADPSFPGTQFVESALHRMKEDERRRHELFELQEKLFDDLFEDPKAEQAAVESVKAGNGEENAGKLANSFGTHTLHMVLERAGPILLQIPDTVRAALRDGTCCQAIAEALQKLGPAAVAFAPDLMSSTRTAASAERYGMAFPGALASVAQNDRATVLQLLDLIKASDSRVASCAAEALAIIGPNAVRLMPPLVDDLLAHRSDPERSVMIFSTLAPIAPDSREVFDRLVVAAHYRPPEIRPMEGYEQYTYDAAMYRRGPAIEALGHFRVFADEAVAVLIDALDTFEEYDSDWGYENGRHGRVVSALSRLMPASAAAVPALLRHLRDRDGDIDWRIIRFLAELGPAAQEALPALRRLQADLSRLENTSNQPTEPPDEHCDPLGWAIHRIEVR